MSPCIITTEEFLKLSIGTGYTFNHKIIFNISVGIIVAT